MAIQTSIIGNLGADAELVTLGQTQALKFRVASTRSRKDKNGQRVTDWVQVVYFRPQLQQYLTKGTKVVVYGELESNPWTTQQGQIQAGLQVTAHAVEFVGASENASTMQQPQQAPPQMQAPPPAPQQPQAQPTQYGSQLPF